MRMSGRRIGPTLREVGEKQQWILAQRLHHRRPVDGESHVLVETARAGAQRLSLSLTRLVLFARNVPRRLIVEGFADAGFERNRSLVGGIELQCVARPRPGFRQLPGREQDAGSPEVGLDLLPALALRL